MNSIPTQPIRIRHQTRLRLVQVARAEQISPKMCRITLAGDALDGFVTAAPDDHVKLFFPAEGQALPVLPESGGASCARDYTPRRFDPARRELVIDFVLHGDGPATLWAARAKPGDWLGVGGPRGSFLPPEADTTLLAGDESALPAISRFLEEMQPGARAIALIEVAGLREQRHLPTAGNVAITWLHRNGMPPGSLALLGPALQGLTLHPGSVFAWLAGEIDVVRSLRHTLIAQHGLDRSQIRAAGYWRSGTPGAHDRIED
jgi:NADPH-dependent ferric siderophore reductase